MRDILKLLLLAATLFTPREVAWGQEAAAPETPATAEAETKPTIDPQLAERLSSPAKTMETFLTAVNEDRLADAAECLDLSQVTLTEQVKATEYAYKLKEIIDRMVRVKFEDIDRAQDPNLFRLNYIVSGMSDDELGDAALITILPDQDGLWRFSADTVASIDDLFGRWKDRARQRLSTTSKTRKPPAVWLADQFPSYQEIHFLIPDYQWICLLILVFIGFVADFLTRGILNGITYAWLRYRGDDVCQQKRMWKPIGLLVQALVWYNGAKLVSLPPLALDFLLIGLKLFAAIAAIWTAFHLIDLLGAVVARRAARTATKFDDLLVPLVSKTLKVVAVCVGVVECTRAVGLPLPVGILGTLGLGGMAFALASQDAVSNLFGSLTVLMDRPFEVGDWVKTEDIEGSVETVGFRSTRIRTFYNSLITLPNSRLTTATVDNMGRRRYRRIRTMLSLQYDTSPEQIDAFCEGVRELLRRHPYTRKDYYHVYLNQFSGSSLDVLLYCFLECPDWAVELRERHRLFVDILKLADSLQVSFAFPTRTLHMIEEQPAEGNGQSWDDPHTAGQSAAARIAGKRTRKPLGPVRFEGPSMIDEDCGDGDGE